MGRKICLTREVDEVATMFQKPPSGDNLRSIKRKFVEWVGLLAKKCPKVETRGYRLQCENLLDIRKCTD